MPVITVCIDTDFVTLMTQQMFYDVILMYMTQMESHSFVLPLSCDCIWTVLRPSVDCRVIIKCLKNVLRTSKDCIMILLRLSELA